MDKNQLADVLSKLIIERYFHVFFFFFAHASCIKVAITVRGRVLKFTLVVDNDTTVHDVHTSTVAFSQSLGPDRV